MTNQNAFLLTIPASELTPDVVKESDRGYNVLVGSLPGAVNTFASYADHPRQTIWLPRLGIHSTAAGAYQIREAIFDAYKVQLNLPDFSPESQDKIALQLIRECHALDLIDAGQFSQAIYACSSRWASFPGNQDGQHEQAMDFLQSFYVASGGSLAEAS